MHALVVYESLWGNTAAVARAIAEGIGEAAQALPTSEASPDVVADADLIVVGAPLLGFSLPTRAMRESVRNSETRAPSPPDLSHASVAEWLDSAPSGQARFATFETRIWWSPGSAMKQIASRLKAAGYVTLAKPRAFIVTGRYGPLRDGELERARSWGHELRNAMG